MSVEVPIYVLQSLFSTFEAQCGLIKGLLNSHNHAQELLSQSPPQPVVAQSSIASISVQNKTSYNELETRIENLIFEKMTLEKELENMKVKLIIQAELPGEFERGFKEGMKMAKQEQILNLGGNEVMTSSDSKEQLLPESCEKQDDKMKMKEEELEIAAQAEPECEPEMETRVESVVNLEEDIPEPLVGEVLPSDQNAQQVPESQVQEAQVQEDQSEEDQGEEDQDEEDQNQEEETPDFEEIQLKGRTYYLDIETLKFYLPTEDGEIDIESPVGHMNSTTNKAVFYHTSSKTT